MLDDWRKAIVVPLYKGKGSWDGCGNYGRISLLDVPGKVYRSVLTKKLVTVTGNKVSDEQGGFRKRRECVDQIFKIKLTVEKYLGER